MRSQGVVKPRALAAAVAPAVARFVSHRAADMTRAPTTPRPRPPVKAEVALVAPPAAVAVSAQAAAVPPATAEALRAWRSDGVMASAGAFADAPPPRLLLALNDPDMLPPEAGEPDDPQGIADLLLDRARDGSRLARVFAHASFAAFDGREGEAWARAVTEHLSGIPIADPARLYAEGRPAIARAMFVEGRVPLAALSEDAVTAALCAGGWDGGPYGDVGRGRIGLDRCKELGSAITCSSEPSLSRPFAEWDGALWDHVGPGTCLFWAGAGGDSGRVAVVLRKQGDGGGRVLQVFGALSPEQTSDDPPVLSEGELWSRIPTSFATELETFGFAGLGQLASPGAVRVDLRPRGRCRLLLRRRSDGKPLYRSAWISMAAEGISTARLLCSLRSSPQAHDIEATWRVHSLCLTPTAETPDSAFLVACTAGQRGRVTVLVDPADRASDALEPGAFLDGGKAEF
jgi:hypothetical protein